MKRFGEELKSLRLQSMLTLSKAAEIFSKAADRFCSAPQWSRWESGAVLPRLETINILCNIFQLNENNDLKAAWHQASLENLLSRTIKTVDKPDSSKATSDVDLASKEKLAGFLSRLKPQFLGYRPSNESRVKENFDNRGFGAYLSLPTAFARAFMFEAPAKSLTPIFVSTDFGNAVTTLFVCEKGEYRLQMSSPAIKMLFSRLPPAESSLDRQWGIVLRKGMVDNSLRLDLLPPQMICGINGSARGGSSRMLFCESDTQLLSSLPSVHHEVSVVGEVLAMDRNPPSLITPVTLDRLIHHQFNALMPRQHDLRMSAWAEVAIQALTATSFRQCALTGCLKPKQLVAVPVLPIEYGGEVKFGNFIVLRRDIAAAYADGAFWIESDGSVTMGRRADGHPVLDDFVVKEAKMPLVLSPDPECLQRNAEIRRRDEQSDAVVSRNRMNV